MRFCDRNLIVMCAVLGTSLVLGGCKIEAEVPLYTSDIRSTADSEKPIDMTMEIRVPIPSADKCDEYGPKALEVIATEFRKSDLLGCGKNGFDSFAKIQVSTTIQEYSEAIDFSKLPDALAVVASHGDSQIVVVLVQRTGALKSITAKAEERFHAKAEQISISATVNNDEKETAKVNVVDVFWNSRPVLYLEEIGIERRRQGIIELSSVANAAFFDGEPVRLLTMNKQ